MNTSHLCLITRLWSSVYIKIYCYATQTCCYPKFYCSELLPSEPPNHKAKVMEHLVLKYFFFLLLSNFVFLQDIFLFLFFLKKKHQKKPPIFYELDFLTEISLARQKVTLVSVCFVKQPNHRDTQPNLQLMSVGITLLSSVE